MYVRSSNHSKAHLKSNEASEKAIANYRPILSPKLTSNISLSILTISSSLFPFDPTTTEFSTAG